MSKRMEIQCKRLAIYSFYYVMKALYVGDFHWCCFISLFVFLQITVIILLYKFLWRNVSKNTDYFLCMYLYFSQQFNTNFTTCHIFLRLSNQNDAYTEIGFYLYWPTSRYWNVIFSSFFFRLQFDADSGFIYDAAN